MNDPEGQCASRIAWTVDHERVASRGHDPVVDVCVTPRASFGFHMAQTLTPIGYFSSDYWSRYMMAYYPPEIREWIISKGGLTPELKILHGEELAALIPRCPWEPRAGDAE